MRIGLKVNGHTLTQSGNELQNGIEYNTYLFKVTKDPRLAISAKYINSDDDPVLLTIQDLSQKL